VTSLIFTQERFDLIQGIPEDIGKLTELKFLAINNTRNFPSPSIKFISNLFNLEHLDLSANNIRGMALTSNNFGNLKNLKYLNVSRNELEDNLNVLTKQFSKIKDLDLSQNHFIYDDFNNAFTHLTQLEVLILSNGILNNVSRALPSILNLPLSLRVLDLWFCFNIPTTLPINLKSFTNLKSLTLNGNSLYGSLDALAGITNLTTLQLGTNSFSGEIPSFIADMNLISLDFSYNKFSKLPKNFKNLKHLEN
ncbi:hypothetical protein HK099_003423, partial [Clydaea vesicula]